MRYAMFQREGGALLPHPDVASPWTEGAINGAAVSALAAALSQEVPAPFPWHCSRMALELLRPVPAVPLHWSVETVREGRRQQVLRLMLGDGRQVSAIATFIRLRVAEAPAMTLQESSFTPAPGEPFRPTVQGRRDGFLQRIEASLQPRQDVAHRRGWLRFRGEVIAGVPLSPLAQAALFADFGNGMAAGVDPQRFTFQNAELTLHLARLPRGSWVHLDCRTLDGGAGIGMTRTVFSDPDGDLGYAHQSLLIDPIA